MPRLKLVLPPNNIAQVHIPVRISDINYGNHVGNDAFVSIIHEARVQWLNQHQFTELNAAGIGLIMSELLIEFKQESFYGDQLIVQLFCGEITSVSFELFYQISTKRTEKSITIAHAKTGMVCFDYEKKKVAEIPEKLLNILLQVNKSD